MEKNGKLLNGFHFRLLAMITMVTDHIGWQFCGESKLITGIGRIAFPLYAFLLADGFLHSKDSPERIEKHLSMLCILAVVAEFCYDVMESGFHFEEYMSDQSVMPTLLLGYLAILATEKLNGNKAALLCVYLLAGFANYLLHANFNLVGPWLVIAFYWYLKNVGNKSWIQRLLILFCIFTVYLPSYFWVRSGMIDTATWLATLQANISWIIFHYVAAVILSLYSGELGYHSKNFSTLYTWFYPLHALIIGLISWLGFGGPF